MSLLTIILLLVGLIILGGVIYLSRFPGSFTIEEKLFIEAGREKIFKEILNFRNWRNWSPWVMHEPDAKITYSKNLTEVGGSYYWEGKYIGSGRMTHSEIFPNEHAKQDLEFIKPFKSKAVAEWKLAAKEIKKNGKKVKGTEVSWILHSSMPFLFRFMSPLVISGVSQDYKLGLTMLANLVNPKADKIKFNFAGVRQQEERTGIYDSFRGKLSELPRAIAGSMQKLEERVKKEKLKLSGFPLVAYISMDMKKQSTHCDTIFTLKDDSIEGVKTYPGGKYFQLDYYGSYQYMSLAWYTAMNHIRMKRLKMDKSRPSMEVYETDPRKVKSPDKYKTVILVPVK